MGPGASFLLKQAWWCRSIELGRELAVGGASGGEVVVTVLELELEVDGLLFEGGDPGWELFGVVGAAAPRNSPNNGARTLMSSACVGNGESGSQSWPGGRL
ncbi:hypothetical protein [Streptomyces sp. NPDC024089]|uniref:hypothetical protein n=1 Tax=Streptomyces sp. NPDC024089 TaxID=3154328 RepID=UPI0033FDB934